MGIPLSNQVRGRCGFVTSRSRQLPVPGGRVSPAPAIGRVLWASGKHGKRERERERERERKFGKSRQTHICIYHHGSSSLASTIIICHSSCLNCALYIFDKAAQDQVIGVTDHELLH